MHTVELVRGVDYRVTHTVSELMSIRHWMNIHVGPEFPAPMICLYQGMPLLRDQWESTLICADVAFIPVPLGGGGGGGKNVMGMIGMVLVMALAAVATWGVADLIAGGGTMSLMGVTGLTGLQYGIASAAGLAVMMADSMLVNALFPSQTNMPKIDMDAREAAAASPTYSLGPTQNQARLYQVIPEGFGTMMSTPDLAAQPYMEFIGNEQYVHQLLCIGVGEYQLQRIEIVDTTIWENGYSTGSFPEIEIEIVNPGERITLFPDNVETAEEVAGQTLNQGVIGPFTANSAGTQTTAIAIDIVFPRGLGFMNDKGGIDSRGLTVRFDYQEINDQNQPIGPMYELASRKYENATLTPQRYTFIINVPQGRYRVQGYCVSFGYSTSRQVWHDEWVPQPGTEDGGYYNSWSEWIADWTELGCAFEDNRTMSEVQWVGMKAYLPSKLVYPDLTLIAVRARATNALSQQSARQFQVLWQRKLPKWNPSTGWSAPQPTNSWAWAMAWMAKAPWGGRRTDRQIDLQALYRLDQELTARGDEFCQVIDSKYSVWGLFTEACRCVRVLPRNIMSTISWMRDDANRPVRGVFTPYNIVRDSFSVDYAFFSDDSPDDIIFEYLERDGWIERDVRAALPDSLSMEPARKRVLGITSRAQGYREACFEIACNAYRRTFPKWSTEMEGFLLFRGDMVLLTHPLGGESQWASVKSWDAAAHRIEVDTQLEMEAGQSHYAVLRKPNGQPYGPVQVISVVDKILTFDAGSLATAEDKEHASGNPQIWEWLSDGIDSVATHVIFGHEDPGVRAIILSVKPRQNGMCDIEAVIEDERVHFADLGPVPPWTPGGETSPITPRPDIQNLIISFDFDSAMLALSWSPSPGATRYHVQSRNFIDSETFTGWTEWNDVGQFVPANASFIVPRALVEVRIRGLTAELAGPWLTRQINCAFPMPVAPEMSLEAPYVGGNLSLGWDEISTQEIVVILSSGGSERMRKSVPGTSNNVLILPSEMQPHGGPWRMLNISALAINGLWEVPMASFDIADPPPSKVQNVQVSVSAGVATVSWDAVSDADLTGYGVGHVKPDGGITRHLTVGLETSIQIPVVSGSNSFVVAARDALFDVIGDENALNFSDTVTVEV